MVFILLYKFFNYSDKNNQSIVLTLPDETTIKEFKETIQQKFNIITDNQICFFIIFSIY